MPISVPPLRRLREVPHRLRDALSTRLAGDREVAHLVSRTLAVVYAVLVPLRLVFLTGELRVVMVVLAAASSAVAVAVARRAISADNASMARLPWVLCSLPLVNSLSHLAVSHELQETTVVMLTIVGIGAIVTRARDAAALIAGGCAAWAALALTVLPGPGPLTGHYALQLALACALATAVFAVRVRILARVDEAQMLVIEQAVEAAELAARTEESLRQFRGIFDDSPVAIGVLDAHGRFLRVNPALGLLSGRAPEDLVGRSWSELSHPDDLGGLSDVWPTARGTSEEVAGGAADGAADGTADGVQGAAGPVVGRVEQRVVRRDGEIRWAWLSWTHAASSEGELRTILHLQDSTERKAAEEAVTHTQQWLQVAADVARAVQRGEDPRPVVLTGLCDVAAATTATLIEPRDDTTLVVSAASARPELVGTLIPLDEDSATAHVWRTGAPLFVSGLDDHPLVSPRLRELSGARSMLWQPIGRRGPDGAVLAVVWDHTVAEVTGTQRAAVSALADELGSALVAERLRRRLEQSSETDPLTGLLNRRGWDRAVGTLWHEAVRASHPVTVAIVDLDHFKAFNDAHGHHAGDEQLAAFARGVQQTLRVVDVLARWGGEEFVVALHDCTQEDAAVILDRARACVPGSGTASVGYAQLFPGEDVSEALRRADRALYEAKRRGRDRSLPAVPSTSLLGRAAQLIEPWDPAASSPPAQRSGA